MNLSPLPRFCFRVLPSILNRLYSQPSLLSTISTLNHLYLSHPPPSFPSTSHPNMVGRHISDDIKEMALSMSLQGLQDSEIHEFTGISVRSLKRLRSTYRKIGQVSRKREDPGRPRTLTSMHRKVRLTKTQFGVHLTEKHSFFVIVWNVSLIQLLQSCRQNSGRFVVWRYQFKRLHALSKRRATR